MCASHGHGFSELLWAHKYCVEMGHGAAWSWKVVAASGACDYPDDRDSFTDYWSDGSSDGSGWTYDGSHGYQFSEIVCASGPASPTVHYYNDFPTFNLGDSGIHALCGNKGSGSTQWQTADHACKTMGHQGAVKSRTADSSGGSCWYYNQNDAFQYDGSHGTFIKDVICYDGFPEDEGSVPPGRIITSIDNQGVDMGVPINGEWTKIVVCASRFISSGDADVADAFCKVWGFDTALRFGTQAVAGPCAYKGSDNDTPVWDDPSVWTVDLVHGTSFSYIHCQNNENQG